MLKFVAHDRQHEGHAAGLGAQQMGVRRPLARVFFRGEAGAFDEVHHRHGNMPEFVAGPFGDLQVLADQVGMFFEKLS